MKIMLFILFLLAIGILSVMCSIFDAVFDITLRILGVFSFVTLAVLFVGVVVWFLTMLF